MGVDLKMSVRWLSCNDAAVELVGVQVAAGREQPDAGASQCSATELRQPDNHQPFTILYRYCTGGTECLSCTHIVDVTSVLSSVAQLKRLCLSVSQTTC